MILGVAGAALADFPVAENGQPKCVVVAGAEFANQAKNLTDYLAAITGAKIPVVASEAAAQGQPAIILEKVAKVPGSSAKVTARQAYRIKADDKTLRLTGGSDHGVTYAVWGLLEDHLGCRFYTFKGNSQPDFEIVPKKATLAVGKLDDFQEPAFMQRGFIWWPASDGWVVKNRGGGYPGDNTAWSTLMAVHNFYKLMPPDDGNDMAGVARKGWFKDHPEWAPLTDGKRQPSWAMGFCYSNPELPKELAVRVAALVEQRKAQKGDKYDPAVPVSMAQGDGFAACECDVCRKVVAEEESWAGPLILMCNRTIEVLEKQYPNQTYITHAYFETLKAPKKLRPHPKLYISLVSSDLSQNPAGDNVGRIAGNPAMRAYAQALQDWPKIAPDRVGVWDWRVTAPEWPGIFYLAENQRYFRDCGVAASLPQPCESTAWRPLFCWLHLKLAWNPDADADKLIRQYLNDVYGPKAAPILYDYFKLTQAAYEDSLYMPSVCRSTGWTETMNAKIYQPYIPRMTALMDQALAAAKSDSSPLYLQNVTAAMANSIDPVYLADAKRAGVFGAVKNPADGKTWWVPGGNAALPAVIQRLGAAAGYSGGPLVELKGKAGSAGVCARLKGQVVGFQANGKELLVSLGEDAGYKDDTKSQWIGYAPLNKEAEIATLATGADLWAGFQPPADKLETAALIFDGGADHRLRRTVSVTDAGLKIERQYVNAGAKPAAPADSLRSRWLLALSDPKTAKVSVTGAGIQKLIDLQYAVPGGIKGIKAGERPKGVDYLDKKWDEVFAVADAEVTKLPVAANAAGDIVVQIDRGDGVAAVLTTPAAGWASVEIKPVVGSRYMQGAGAHQLAQTAVGSGQRYVEVTLVGAPLAITAENKTAALPAQTLSAKKMPVVRSVGSVGSVGSDGSVAKLKLTGPTTAINEADGAELVWVAAGEFLRGTPEGKGAGDERPQKKITLDGYWIYKNTISRAQYEKFCAATGRKFEPMWSQTWSADPKADRQQLPAMVSWYEAADYAKWANAALPTEAQWEKAARGTDGREYPWGNDWDPAKCVSKESTLGKQLNGFLPVGSVPSGASPCGALDMAGSVWEWTADWYDYEAYKSAPDKNPTGPATGTYKAVRGGCVWFDERFSRTAARFIQPPQARDWTAIGFRCVVNAPGPEGK
jgi:formylglycine-generating enzyme required for sulfatase activity